MKIIRVHEEKEEFRRVIDRHQEAEEYEPSPEAAQRSCEIFGEVLTPQNAVERILKDIQKEGNLALLRYTELIDRVKLNSCELLVSEDEIQAAYKEVDDDFLKALKKAQVNIETYHRNQIQKSWFITDDDGVILGQKVAPIERVGLYVPGGRAAYPSSVLMNVIPAKVAGVKEVIMVTPPSREGKINPYSLVAASETGIKRIYKIGGAQAIAALAYGTESIPQVDKIVGPGNIFVALAKRAVFGRVGIDMIAGPSEIAIIADESGSPSFIAADLLSQAEHDPDASCILITPCKHLAEKVKKEVQTQLEEFSRREVAEASIMRHGYIFLVDSIEEAFEVANKIAPEHLELLIEEPFKFLDKVKNAGAVFLGPYSPEPVGDYMAGSNHVLPTSGTARFSSGLSVDAFIKKISIVGYTEDALLKTGSHIIRLTEAEGLYAHGKAVSLRILK